MKLHPNLTPMALRSQGIEMFEQVGRRTMTERFPELEYWLNVRNYLFAQSKDGLPVYYRPTRCSRTN